jgi:hypothetical protein
MDNVNFDLIHALEAKLEGLQVYEQYIRDAQQANDPNLAQVFQQQRQQDQQSVTQLQQLLIQRVQNNQFH